MSSVKIFDASHWDGQLSTEQYQIKIASGGLMPNDRREAEKRLDPAFLHWLSGIETHPDCFYVSKVAMGGSHRYGPNRWGDGFREEVLKRDVKTFESAKAYRQHKSDGPYYGQVKLARFREDDGFVDLVTEYFGTDAVAKKFGGLIADDEIEELQKHGHISVSMGSLVPGDACVICNHWAPKPKDRCESRAQGGTCELFGCKTGMLCVSGDGRMNFVDNPINRFYDISKVRIGADPIANGLLLPIGDFQIKAAELVAKTAEFAFSTLDLDQVDLSKQERVALDLAYYWSDLEPKTAGLVADELDAGYALHVTPGLSLTRYHRSGPESRHEIVRGLIRDRQLPDFTTFAKSAGWSQQQIDHGKTFLPNLYTRLIRTGALVPVLKRAGISRISTENNSGVFASRGVVGIDLSSVTRRALLHNANSGKLVPRKLAAFDEAIPTVVTDYAAIKLAYFVAKREVDTAVLRGVVRRDLFDCSSARESA